MIVSLRELFLCYFYDYIYIYTTFLLIFSALNRLIYCYYV